MIEKHPQSTTVIRFQDCDAFGHLNNARFINYFINAREDHLRTYYDFDLYAHARASGENWLVTRHQVAYLRPAMLGEVVRITTRLIDVTADALTVEGVMADASDRQLKAVQWTTFRYVSLHNGRPTTHPSEVMALLQRVEIDEDLPLGDLDARLRDLKKYHRNKLVEPVT